MSFIRNTPLVRSASPANNSFPEVLAEALCQALSTTPH